MRIPDKPSYIRASTTDTRASVLRRVDGELKEMVVGNLILSVKVILLRWKKCRTIRAPDIAFTSKDVYRLRSSLALSKGSHSLQTSSLRWKMLTEEGGQSSLTWIESSRTFTLRKTHPSNSEMAYWSRELWHCFSYHFSVCASCLYHSRHYYYLNHASRVVCYLTMKREKQRRQHSQRTKMLCSSSTWQE